MPGGKAAAAHQALAHGGLVCPGPCRGSHLCRTPTAAEGCSGLGCGMPSRGCSQAVVLSLPQEPCAHQVSPLRLHPGTQGYAGNGPARAGSWAGGRGQGSSRTPQGSAEPLRCMGSGWQRDHRSHWALAVLRCRRECHGLSGATGPGPRRSPLPGSTRCAGTVPPALLITILFGAAAAAVI